MDHAEPASAAMVAHRSTDRWGVSRSERHWLWAVLPVLPMVLLLLRTLAALLVVSDPAAAAGGSWLAGFGSRVPGWVVAVAAVAAAVTWQLRFFPTLLGLLTVLVALLVRERVPGRRPVVVGVTYVLPAVVAVVEYALVAPYIAESFHRAESGNAVLLLLPPILAVLLSGPVPRRPARALTHLAASCVMGIWPLPVAVTFLQTPVLPTVAIELADEATPNVVTEVVRAQVVGVDDRMTTLLDSAGEVRFVPNETVRSKTLCDLPEQTPTSDIRINGWPIERAVFDWPGSWSGTMRSDPRCDGRPLVVGR